MLSILPDGTSGAPPMPPPGRSRRRWILVALVVLALGGYLVYRVRTSGFDWSAFTATFHNVNWLWLALSIPAILLTYVGRALRWEVMVRPMKEHPSFWKILDATCIGFTAVVFFGRAGELVRPYLVSVQERVPFSSQVAVWVLERILDLLMVILIFGLALAQVSNAGLHLGPKTKLVVAAGGAMIGISGAFCLLLLVLFRYMSDSMHRRVTEAITFLPERHRARADRLLAAFIQGLGSTRSNIVQLVALSVLEWSIIACCFVCMFRAFPQTARYPITDVVVFMGFTALGSAIQIPGIGGGTQVASILVFTEIFRISLAASTGLALVMWLVTFVTVVPVGLFLAFRQGLNWRSLSHIREAEPSSIP